MRVIEKLGEGAFGEVYQCVHPQTGEVCAVKVLKGPQTQADLEREVNILEYVAQQLNPDENNIVKFREYFTWNNRHCLAFEMLDKSLYKLQEQKKTLALSEIRVITPQILMVFRV